MRLYRIGNFCVRRRIPILPLICDFLIRIIHNSAVYSCTSIGEGTVFGYGGIALVIHKNSKIGKFCMIGPHVTIGGRSKSESVPIIGNGVYLATGAKVLGSISIGDNAFVGANAVVIADVAPNTVVAGVPAKVIRVGVIAKDLI